MIEFDFLKFWLINRQWSYSLTVVCHFNFHDVKFEHFDALLVAEQEIQIILVILTFLEGDYSIALCI